ncbi:MAG: PKD domain-containing protein, partial [Bacteroidota bacterium]
DGGVVQDDGDPNDNDFLVLWDTPGTKSVVANVVSNISGCVSLPVTRDIEIIAPLGAAQLRCEGSDTESVSIGWDPVPGATGYQLTASNGEALTVDAATTNHTISGLFPEMDIQFWIVAIGPGPCNDAPQSSLVCATEPCPSAVITAVTDDRSLCLDGTETAFSLLAVLTDSSTTTAITWSGVGVEGQGVDARFNPVGLPAGVYRIFVDYDGPSICDSRDSVEITLLDLPIVSIANTPTEVCAGVAVDLGLGVPLDPSVSYTWDFDGGEITDLGNERFEVFWSTPGTKTVSVTAMNECVASTAITIEVTPTLAALTPACVRQDLDGVLFEWPAVAEATEGYQVSLNGGPYGATQTETSLLVNGLQFGETVTIRVRSVRSGTTCDLSAPSTEISCAARSCPTISFEPAAAQTTFCADETNIVLLEANPSVHDGDGLATWQGPGVVDNNDGTFSFDPSLAGVGDHLLTVNYLVEGLCEYAAELNMQINPIPSADFTLSDTEVCADFAVSLQLEDAPDLDASYNWDFAGASVVDNGNQSYSLSWSAAGTYSVGLEVTRNGCLSQSAQAIIVVAPNNAGIGSVERLERCVGDAETVDLNTLLVGATPGGVWSIISGDVSAGDYGQNTGLLNPANLAPGDYRFAYVVSGGSCPPAATEVEVRLLASPIADAGSPETLTCNMGMVSLNGSNSEMGDGYTYRWTSQDSNMIMDADQLIIDVGQPGIYTLEVTNNIGCTATDEVEVAAETEAPVMRVELSQISCFQADDGAILVTGVDGGRPPYTFQVNGEDRGRNTLFPGLAPASYDIQVTDANGCFSNVVVDLTQPEELTVRLRFPGDSNLVNFGEEILITASVNGGNPIDTLIWQPDSLKTAGQAGIQFTARETQMISVTVVDELGCTATDREMLLVRKDRPVYFPTAFSPNGDNNNDVFFIGGDLDQVEFIEDFFIYNRWGEAVYTGGQIDATTGTATGESRFLPNDPDFGWDGRLNGKLMNPQVFVYTATVHFTDGEKIIYKGDFVLMR